MRPSLEEERRALLAQIETSRAVYQRLLSGSTGVSDRQATHSSLHGTETGNDTDFPRSRTVRWMMDHPLAVAAGVGVLVWAAPRWWASARRGRSGKLAEHEPRQARRDVPTEGTGRALLTAAALLMRNPATMRTLEWAASTAWRWFQHRRAHR